MKNLRNYVEEEYAYKLERIESYTPSWHQNSLKNKGKDSYLSRQIVK